MHNLLSDEWLTVEDAAGETQKIALHKITGGGERSFTDLCAPRADFKGAIYQLLIGLLQCTFAPADRREWQRYWREPPTPEELQSAFAPVSHLFEICVESGPAFMQDLELQDGVENSIEELLIDATETHFNKPGRVKFICPYWAAIALFTLQINAPAGGRGHRVSLRGGGPLTTLLLPPVGLSAQTLWHCLWLNVLTRREFDSLHGNHDLKSQEAIYPWSSPARVSEKKGSETFPEHVNALHMYWSMPRRIRLGKVQACENLCDLSGEPIEFGISSYMAKSYGHNYDGAWVHPLTPYVDDASKPPPLPLKGQPGGLGYRHWLGIALSVNENKLSRQAARIVQAYCDSRRDWIAELNEADDEPNYYPQLWVFGYDMDNMKARCWYESTLPLMAPTAEQHDDVVEEVQLLINAAQDARRALLFAVKKVWFSRPKDAKGDTSEIDKNFWTMTEPAFYQCLQQVLAQNKAQSRGQWGKALRQATSTLFEHYTIPDASVGSGGFQRVIAARDGKDGLNHGLNKSKSFKALEKSGKES